MFVLKLPLILLMSLSSISSSFVSKNRINNKFNSVENKILTHEHAKFDKEKLISSEIIHNIFNQIKYSSKKVEVISEFSNIDEVFNNKKEQEDNVSSRRITVLHFEKDIFNDSDSTSKNYALETRIGNNINFNNKTIYELALNDPKVELLKENNKCSPSHNGY